MILRYCSGVVCLPSTISVIEDKVVVDCAGVLGAAGAWYAAGAGAGDIAAGGMAAGGKLGGAADTGTDAAAGAYTGA